MTYNYPPVPSPVPVSQNGFGTAALVLGVIGLLFSFIPIVGIIAWPLVILGLIFAILGLVQVSSGRAHNKGVAVAGAVTSGLGLLVCIAWVFGIAATMPAAGTVASGTVANAPHVAAAPKTVDPAASVARLGQTFTYPDGLAVSVSTPQPYTADRYASPEQYRGQQVMLLTVTVTNNSSQPFQVNSMWEGPTVTQGGQTAVPVFDNSLPVTPLTTVLPGRSFSYRHLYAMASGEIQAEWRRDIWGTPAVFTG